MQHESIVRGMAINLNAEGEHQETEEATIEEHSESEPNNRLNAEGESQRMCNPNAKGEHQEAEEAVSEECTRATNEIVSNLIAEGEDDGENSQ